VGGLHRSAALTGGVPRSKGVAKEAVEIGNKNEQVAEEER